jgi:Leucine-rich repeat (LRR) protein
LHFKFTFTFSRQNRNYREKTGTQFGANKNNLDSLRFPVPSPAVHAHEVEKKESMKRQQRKINPAFLASHAAEDPLVVPAAHGRGVEMQLKQAQRTGHLRLCNSVLRSVPANAFLIHEVRFGEDDQWWDRAPLTRIDLANNEIEDLAMVVEEEEGKKKRQLKELWPEVSSFSAAQNKIASISPQLFHLEKLTTLDLRSACSPPCTRTRTAHAHSRGITARITARARTHEMALRV